MCALVHVYQQVLSESVCKALTLIEGETVKETVKFVTMMDKYFDALNVSNLTNGKHKRKPFQNPYQSADDFRLVVS